MKEVDGFLKMLSEGLKAISQGVEAFARKIDEVSTRKPADEKPRPEKKERAPRKNAPIVAVKTEKSGARKAKKAVAKEKPSRPRAPGRGNTAAKSVFDLIAKTPEGLDTASLTTQTGFNEKKIHNIVYKLKKQGKIKTERKGVYSAV